MSPRWILPCLLACSCFAEAPNATPDVDDEGGSGPADTGSATTGPSSGPTSGTATTATNSATTSPSGSSMSEGPATTDSDAGSSTTGSSSTTDDDSSSEDSGGSSSGESGSTTTAEASCDGVDNTGCPAGCEGAAMPDGRTYAFCGVQRVWTVARESCIEAQADLVRIDDSDENSFLGGYAQIVFGTPQWIWTGGNDRTSEGEWNWLDDETDPFWVGDQNGDEFKFTKWHATDPNGGFTENCAGLWSGADEWLDLDCQMALFYICEFPEA